MEDKIFENLLELYQSRGISFEHLLKNDVFKALPMEAKIRLIKEHADKLSDGIKFDSSDVKYLLKTVGATALAGGLLHQAYTRAFSANHPSPIMAAILAGASSAPIKSALGNINKFKTDMAHKRSIRESLEGIDEDGSIKLLARINGLR